MAGGSCANTKNRAMLGSLPQGALQRGGQGAVLGFIGGVVLETFLKRAPSATTDDRQGDVDDDAPAPAALPDMQEQKENDAPDVTGDDELIAGCVQRDPQLAAALDEVASLTRRLDPLYMQGARWWCGRLVCLADTADSVDANATASRFKREALVLLGAASQMLLTSESGESYAQAVEAAIGGVAERLTALVSAVGTRVRAAAQVQASAGAP